jgi:hypothetical protein
VSFDVRVCCSFCVGAMSAGGTHIRSEKLQ